MYAMKSSDTDIAFTKVKLAYGWLGNMSPYPVNHDEVTWRTTEALFQALRFDDQAIKEAIRAEKSPMAAKLVAKKNADKMVVEQLSDEDVLNMRLCLDLKVQQHPNLLEALLATGVVNIIEDCTKRGNKGSNLFWGAIRVEDADPPYWKGENVLGQLWMEIRENERGTSA